MKPEPLLIIFCFQKLAESEPCLALSLHSSPDWCVSSGVDFLASGAGGDPAAGCGGLIAAQSADKIDPSGKIDPGGRGRKRRTNPAIFARREG